MRTVVYIAGVLALVPIILFRPWLGIPAWNAFGILNPQGYVWGFAQEFPYAMIIGGTTLAGLLYARDRKAPPLTAQTVLLFLLFAWMTLTTVFAWSPESAWDQWTKVLKIFVMVFATMMLIHGERKIRVLMLSLAVPLAFFGVKGGVFTLLTGANHRVQGPGGFLGGNTEIGLALSMVLPFIVVIAEQQKVWWMRAGAWITFWLTVIATLFTYSRGAALGLAAVMAVIFLGLKRKLLVVILVVPVLAVAGAVWVPERLTDRVATIENYEADGSAMGRIQAWGVAWNVAVRNPLGAGFNLHATDFSRWISYASLILGQQHTIAAHSIYFQMLGDQGFIGLGLFLGLLVTTLRGLQRVRKSARKDPRLAGFERIAWATQAGLVGYAVSGAFLSLAYFDLFYAFVGLSTVMLREIREAPAASTSSPVVPQVVPISPRVS
ncbi:MAG TPA: putative O-glycosylation ligase, exosortase A system-associated [Burkholderiales bacterium]|jgi:probable O-glycosylation ligase (exosortase A-associated)|nr:putative O-glycosylation ligase, exosortase A system-associated [Burkholderiales bacterium]